jgi:DUF2892 family protein
MASIGKHLSANMGAVDRGIRAFVVAPVVIVAAFAVGASSIGGIVLIVAGGIALATAVTGFCPLYVPFEGSTRRAPLPH